MPHQKISARVGWCGGTARQGVGSMTVYVEGVLSACAASRVLMSMSGLIQKASNSSCVTKFQSLMENPEA
jgi:hypothetical protein